MAECKKKDKILDGQPAYGNVAGSNQYSETGSKTAFWVLVPLLGLGYCPFNRIKSRVVTVLFIGQNTLRRHLYIVGMIDSPLCRRCGAGEETSAHVLCESESLASHAHT
jgi:hypothetical protein